MMSGTISILYKHCNAVLVFKIYQKGFKYLKGSISERLDLTKEHCFVATAQICNTLICLTLHDMMATKTYSSKDGIWFVDSHF